MSERLDEINERKTALKAQINDLRAEAQELSAEQADLIEEEHREAARVSMQAWAAEHGKTLDEAIEYWEGRLTFEEGTSPDPGRWIQALLLQGKRGKVLLG